MAQILQILTALASQAWPAVEPEVLAELQALKAKTTNPALSMAIDLAIAAVQHFAPPVPPTGG